MLTSNNKILLLKATLEILLHDLLECFGFYFDSSFPSLASLFILSLAKMPSSTLRFFCLLASLSFGYFGWVSPYHFAVILSAFTPFDSRKACTAFALFSDSVM